MAIYEYYCRDNHTIYQFYAKTLAQGRSAPRCPDDPRLPLVKLLSPFAVARRAPARGHPEAAAHGPGGEGDDRMASAVAAMEGELAGVDENDPRAMGRIMRRMAELSGEKMDGTMEEVVRKLEEGADPESLEAQLGETKADAEAEPGIAAGASRHRFRARARPPARDPRLYDYE